MYYQENMSHADFSNLYLKYSLHQEHDVSGRGHTSLHCSYQEGEWHYDQFMEWIKRHIIEYALSPREVRGIHSTQYFDAVERASRMVYGAKAKTKRRGEIGELILHGLIYDIYGTRPVVSKVFMKTARNDTVKGFDCVHALSSNDTLESLWLGEAKFYKNINNAISEAIESIKTLAANEQLLNEFMVVNNMIGDDEDPIAQQVKKLLSRSSSFDDIKPKICVPVLLTYESPVVANHKAISNEFITQLDTEVQSHIDKFTKASKGIDLSIHVFVFSLDQKKKLIEKFDTQLKGHQAEE